METNGYGQVYAASDFGDGVPIPDLTVYEDIFQLDTDLMLDRVRN